MNATFPKRRHEILGHPRRGERALSVAKLVKTYPALMETEEVIVHFMSCLANVCMRIGIVNVDSSSFLLVNACMA